MKRSRRAPVRQKCELTTSPSKRLAAQRMTAAIQDEFPKGVSQPALRALAAAEFNKLSDLTRITEAELPKLHGMGPKAITILRAALQERGLSFSG
jgi:hypothetical protein